MKLSEVMKAIQDSTAEDWHILAGDFPTYVHRFNYGSNERGEGIWGLVEHHSRAVLRSNVDVGLVWGMDVSPERQPLYPEWAEPLSAVEKGVRMGLLEILYSGQPISRITYALVDNYSARIPWPKAEYPSNFDPEGPHTPERLTVTAWHLAVVSLSVDLEGGGQYSTPAEYLQRAGIEVI